MLKKLLKRIESKINPDDLSFMVLENIKLTRLETTIEMEFRMLNSNYNLEVIYQFIDDMKRFIDTSNFKNFVLFFDKASLNKISKEDLLKMAKYSYFVNFGQKLNIEIVNKNDINIIFDTTEEEVTFKTSPKSKRRVEGFFMIYGFENVVYSHQKDTAIKTTSNIELNSGELEIFENRASSAKPSISQKPKATVQEMFDIKEYNISDLPFDQIEVDSFPEHLVQIKGTIFNVELKETKKVNIYSYSVYDGIDSIIVKQVISKSKLNNTSTFKEGDYIDVKGEITYDTFARDVLINALENGITLLQKENKEEFVIEETPEDMLRTELHIHTKMSTHDGLNDVSDYFKNAKKYGIKALAITDLENVQAFPDGVVAAKANEIKPIYGCEFNVYDENSHKIVYIRNNEINYEYVGVDIETTGLSNQFDDIIEISAYKRVNNELKTYSVIVKLADMSKLTQKIVDLTSITPELIENEGIDVKDALNGFIEFVGNAFIVAHNATFDVPFLEEKIKTILGKNIKYNFIDTLMFSRVVLKDELKRFSLDVVAKKLKCTLEQHHRAIYDAICCYDIFFALMERLTVNHYSVKDDNMVFPCEGVVKYGTYAKETELRSLIDNSKIVSQNIIEKHTDECGKIVIETNQEYIDEWESSLESPIPYTVDGSLYTFEYNTAESMKLIAKLKTRKGSKKNVINFEKIVTVEKNQGAKGEITLRFDNADELAVFLDYGLKETTTKNDNVSVDTLNSLILKEDLPNYVRPYNAIVIAKNQQGLKDLFKLVSLAHTRYMGRNPQIPLSLLRKYKENLVLGSAGLDGLFRVAFEKSFDEFKSNIDLYDYMELEPLESYIPVSDTRDQKNDIITTIKKIANYCDSINKMVVVGSDAYYIKPEQKIYRDYYINQPMVGGGLHRLAKKNVGVQCLRSTPELIREYSNYVGEDNARRYVVSNTNKVSNMIDDNIRVIHDKLYTPTDDFLKDKVLDVVGHTVPSVKEELKNICMKEVKKYEVNGKLPLLIQKRLDKELNSIIGNGFQVTYYIAYLLVKKSNSDGYIVGSRGSVGSSFVANLMGITEVNALAPHYYCPHCHFTRFKLNDEERKEYGYAGDDLDDKLNSVDDGFDLPDAVCPVCGRPLSKDGHDIPFETFLGFNGDKVPDIDLNFSGDYQWKAHNFCKEVFGADHAFRAGTTSTVAEKTAFGYIKASYERRGLRIRNTEADRQSKELEGTKHTTGQHPGGIIVIPANFDVLDFTPVQYPANDKNSTWLTTHFDFHKIHDNVLKLDILGHDDPTVLKYLMDYVHEHPTEFPFNDVKGIPLDDPEVYQLLYPDKNDEIHSLAIPEFGTQFVTGMLKDTSPKTFAQLVKISGLSHGTDVWLGNAQDLVSGKSGFAKVPFAKIIGCRDDIMVDLIYMGLNPSKAFEIMEFVRKGKPSKDKEKWEELKKYMEEKNVPEWYIWSCEKIKYMFPKAHAVAYVLSAMRIAWFKVHKPELFYSAFLSIRADKFDLKTIVKGKSAIDTRISEIDSNKNSTDVEQAQADVLRVVSECFGRGILIEKPNLNSSDYKTFIINKNYGSLIAPFSAIDGLGEAVAKSITDERETNGSFKSVEDFKERIKSKKINEAVDEFEMEI